MQTLRKIVKWLLLTVGGLTVLLVVIGMFASKNNSAPPAGNEATAAQAVAASNDASATKSQAREEARQAKVQAAAEAKAAAEQKDLDAMPTFTPRDLAKAYEENTVAADQQFKGKRYKVTGVIDEISTDLFDTPYIGLRAGSDVFLHPQFRFSKDSNNQIAKLKKGMKVTVACTGSGDVVKTPMSRDCTLL